MLLAENYDLTVEKPTSELLPKLQLKHCPMCNMDTGQLDIYSMSDHILRFQHILVSTYSGVDIVRFQHILALTYRGPPSRDMYNILYSYREAPYDLCKDMYIHIYIHSL